MIGDEAVAEEGRHSNTGDAGDGAGGGGGEVCRGDEVLRNVVLVVGVDGSECVREEAVRCVIASGDGAL